MSTTHATPTAPSTPPVAAGDSDTGPTLQEQQRWLLTQLAGHVAVRTVAMGLEHGLLARLAEQPGTAEELAETCGLDPFYTAVWCRAAIGAQVIVRRGDGALALAPHLPGLLLQPDAPTAVGGVFTVLTQPEIFDRFSERFASGERMWWDETGHAFIQAVAGTGRPFYARLVPDGLARVPGLTEQLEQGGTVIDTACGSGAGVVRLARTYPDIRIVGVDGDAYSLERAARQVAEAGISDRVTLVRSALEDLDAVDLGPAADGADLVVNNISMHECRDIDRVTAHVRAALRPGGWFVISDLPFPADDAGLTTLPGRVMSGIQFFEAQIDDQLVPVDRYLELLGRHGFSGVDSVGLTPLHAVTWGRR